MGAAWDRRARESERCVLATASSVSVTKCSVHTLCTRQTCDNLLCCSLFGSLFMDTVHKHCSWVL